MRYLLIAALAVSFLAPSSHAWKYGQGTCEDDIACDSHRRMREDNRHRYDRMQENNWRNNMLWEKRRENRIREAEWRERHYQNTLDSLNPECWPWCE